MVEKKVVLREAVADINKEITKLRREKNSFKRQIAKIDSGKKNAHKLEDDLQKKIATLLKKEAKLTERKKDSQVKMDEISDQIGKIQKIKSEITNV